MLPTLAFILAAYVVYALISAWSRRLGQYRPQGRWRRCGWLLLAGSAGAVVGISLWLAMSPDRPEPGAQLGSFLGTVWAEDWPDKTDSRLEYPLIKGQGSGGQPVYALLHPETPPSQVTLEKRPPAPKPVRKPKLQKTAAAQGKVAKGAAPMVKKDRLSAKSWVKKKKQSSSPGSPGGQKPVSG